MTLGRSVLLLCILVLASCTPASRPSTPPPQPGEMEPPAATATSTGLPSATPLPTVTPGPAPTRVPAALLGTLLSRSTVYAGSVITFEISGLEPLERVKAAMEGPGQQTEAVGEFRADRSGRLVWKRDSTGDALGAWTATVSGDLGTQVRVPYTLAELDIPTRRVVEHGTAFRVYQGQNASYFFEEGIPAASVVRLAEAIDASLRVIPGRLETRIDGPLNVYLVSGLEALKREVSAAGADPGAGLEAGVSLYGYKRPGIYLDMHHSAAALPHVAAHELSHQATARIQGGGKPPHWLEEGIAEYMGHIVAKGLEPDQEDHWRRGFRLLARKAVANGSWVPLSRLADQKVWHAEPDVDRGMQYYAQGFVAADHIARTYGEQALRPLFDQLSQSPEAADAPFRGLFRITFEQFEKAVQESVLSSDEYEMELERLTVLARHLFEVAAGEPSLNQSWEEYLAQRSRLVRAERVQRLSALADGYRLLAGRLGPAAGPAVLLEPYELYLESYLGFASAMDRLVSYEQDGGLSKVDQANASLRQGSFLFGAAQDRLGAILTGYYIPAKDVLPAGS